MTPTEVEEIPATGIVVKNEVLGRLRFRNNRLQIMARRERTQEIPFILGRFVQFGEEITDARSAMREIWIFLRAGSLGKKIVPFIPGDARVVLDRVAEKPI